MPGAQSEIWRDIEYLATGTQKGSGTTITDRGKDFRSCGVRPGLAIKNITNNPGSLITTEDGLALMTEDGKFLVTEAFVSNTITTGLIISVTEDEVVTNIPFYKGDTYEIFKTSVYNSKLATIYVDRRAGRKVNDPSQTVNGILIEDQDLDEHTRHIFGPGQPWRD